MLRVTGDTIAVAALIITEAEIERIVTTDILDRIA